MPEQPEPLTDRLLRFLEQGGTDREREHLIRDMHRFSATVRHIVRHGAAPLPNALDALMAGTGFDTAQLKQMFAPAEHRQRVGPYDLWLIQNAQYPEQIGMFARLPGAQAWALVEAARGELTPERITQGVHAFRSSGMFVFAALAADETVLTEQEIRRGAW